MKTNEEAKRQLLELAERAIEQLVEQLEKVKEGDVQQLEQTDGAERHGTGTEGKGNHPRAEGPRRQAPGAWGRPRGHRLRLVGYRERPVMTLMGRIKITRRYSHCEEKQQQNGKEKPESVCAGLELLGEGRIEAVIAAIEKLPALPPPPGKTKSIQETEAEYFRTNQQPMRYPPSSARKSMHLGSGIAEAACKTVVSTRAKRSGMRWTPEGLAIILAVRTALLSQPFEQRWLVYGKGA